MIINCVSCSVCPWLKRFDACRPDVIPCAQSEDQTPVMVRQQHLSNHQRWIIFHVFRNVSISTKFRFHYIPFSKIHVFMNWIKEDSIFFFKRCYLLRNEIWRTYDITEYGSKGQNSFSYFLVSSDKRNIRHLSLFSRDRWNHFEDSLHRLGFLSSSTEISKNSLNFQAAQWATKQNKLLILHPSLELIVLCLRWRLDQVNWAELTIDWSI